MPGLGAFALAGAAQGLGASIVERANQRREAALAELDRERELQDRAQDRDWQVEDRDLGYARDQETYGRLRSDQIEDRDLDFDRDDAAVAREEERIGRTAGVIRGLGAAEPRSQFDRDGVTPDAVAALGRLESITGSTFTVNSAHRDAAHNARVGGARGSQHIHGNAFDVDVSDLSREERTALIQQARAAGFGGVGVYDNSLHFDTGAVRHWGPSYGAESLPGWAAQAVQAPVGTGFAAPMSADAAAVLADPDTPAGARDIVTRGLGIGATAAPDYTDLVWRDNGDGTETRIGRNATTGAYEEVPGPGGEPLTQSNTTASERAGAEAADLSSGLISRLERRFKDRMEETDYQLVDILSGEIRRLMRNDGLTEDEAYNAATAAMVFEEAVAEGEGWFDGPSSERIEQNTEGRGDFTGQFRYGGTTAPPPAAGLGVGAPEAQAVFPAEPGTEGLPRPSTAEEFASLPSGTVFIDPEGRRRVKP